MSENVLITLIIVVGVVVLGIAAVYLLRNRIKSASFYASIRGVQGSVDVYDKDSSSVSGNKIKGNSNSLVAENKAKVKNNEVDGDKNDFVGR